MLSSVPFESFVVFTVVVLVIYNVFVYIHFSRLLRKGGGTPASQDIFEPSAPADSLSDDPVGFSPDFSDGDPDDGVVDVPSISQPSEPQVDVEGSYVPDPEVDFEGYAEPDPVDIESIEEAFCSLENADSSLSFDGGTGQPDFIPASDAPGDADFQHFITESLEIGVPVERSELSREEREALEISETVASLGADSFLSEDVASGLDELLSRERVPS